MILQEAQFLFVLLTDGPHILLSQYAVPHFSVTIQNIQALRSDTGKEVKQETKIRTQETQVVYVHHSCNWIKTTM